MVAVRNCLMSTLSAVGMARVVSGARMGRRAASRIRLARGENVLVDVSLVEMMQVPVVKIILVAIVFDGLVPAVGPVLMIVSVVYRVIRFHRSLSLSPASSLGERCSWPYARAVTLCVVSIERRSTSLAAVISARTRHDHPGSMSAHDVGGHLETFRANRCHRPCARPASAVRVPLRCCRGGMHPGAIEDRRVRPQ